MTPRALLLAGLVAVLPGCSGLDLANYEADSGGGFEIPVSTLRIDVYPSDAGLLPQTRIVTALDGVEGDGRYHGIELSVSPTIHLSGTLTALVSTPYAGAASAPTESVPLTGEIRVWREGTLQAVATRSDAEGTFSLALPADDGYDVAILPDDATATPFLLQDDVVLTADRDYSLELAPGAPLYGRVADADGTPLTGVPLVVRRADLAVDAASATFYTDSRGWFVARVPVGGTYSVEVLGGRTTAGVTIPSVAEVVKVPDEAGATAWIDVGELSANTLLTGAVVDARGERLEHATIVLKSVALDGCASCSLSEETSTDRNGLFIARLLPGEYDLEVIPAAVQSGATSSPQRTRTRIVAGTTDLGEIHLQPAAVLSGSVLTASGEPARDVHVGASQEDFAGFHYDARTDEVGAFHLDVPAGAYRLSLTPADPDQGAITLARVDADEPVTLSLDVGEEVSGVVSYDGAAVPWALIEVRDPETGELLGTTTAGETGTFSLKVTVPTPSRTGDDDGDSGGEDTGGDADTGAADTGAGDSGDTGAADTGAGDSGDTGASDTGASDTGDTGAGDTGTGTSGDTGDTSGAL